MLFAALRLKVAALRRKFGETFITNSIARNFYFDN
jgi:hypothetical protein